MVGREPDSYLNFIDLVNALEATGFFGTVREADTCAVRREIVRLRYLFPKALGRSFHADAEHLAEGGVLEFVAEVAPWLAKCGVRVPVSVAELRPVKVRDPKTGVVSEVRRTALRMDGSLPDKPGVVYVRPVKEEFPTSGDYYRVTVGLRTLEIWNERMTESQMWEAAMCNTLLLINQLLEDAGAAERLYGMFGGNDGLAVILTAEQFELVRKCGEIKESEKPWKPYAVA